MRLIDVDAFIDSLGSEDYDIYCKDAVNVFAEEHEIKPAKQQSGRWMDGGKNEDGTYNIYCSKCGAGFKTRGHARSVSTAKKFKLCPHCGARMEGK